VSVIVTRGLGDSSDLLVTWGLGKSVTQVTWELALASESKSAVSATGSVYNPNISVPVLSASQSGSNIVVSWT
jgi:hypothetical protein